MRTNKINEPREQRKFHLLRFAHEDGTEVSPEHGISVKSTTPAKAAQRLVNQLCKAWCSSSEPCLVYITLKSDNGKGKCKTYKYRAKRERMDQVVFRGDKSVRFEFRVRVTSLNVGRVESEPSV